MNLYRDIIGKAIKEICSLTCNYIKVTYRVVKTHHKQGIRGVM